MIKSKIETDTGLLGQVHEILPYDESRVSLTFYPPQSGVVTLHTELPLFAGQGLVLSAGNMPITLWAKYHGEVVRKAWWAVYAAGATPISWIAGYG